MSTKIQCEICGEHEDILLETHHLHSKCYGGKDTNSNKAVLCLKHHKMVHHGLLVLVGRFDTTQGNKLIWRKYNEIFSPDIQEPHVWLYPNAKIYELHKNVHDIAI